ncbi:potassium transporter Trk [Microbacterium sp. 179-B 1A2 NHS]|uniref:potassium transporter Trk n=1 Tax=Microbacterium sp. 179-B 1A2 NHS TaxID=3142383 RepID=UPI0039A22398
MAEHTESHVESAELHRSPRFGVFFAAGAAVGLIVALILTFAFDGEVPADGSQAVYTPGQIFGFLVLVCVPVGLALAGVVALVFDRALRRRSRTVRVERETVHTDD